MNRRIAIIAAVVVCAVGAVYLTGRDDGKTSVRSAPSVVTADIQSGIEKHIEEQTRLGEGYFRVPFREGELRRRGRLPLLGGVLHGRQVVAR